MPRWDDPHGPRHEHERDHWRREQMRSRGGHAAERRSLDDEERRPEGGRFGGRGDRHGARYDQDRAGYGRRLEDAGEAGYAHHRHGRSSQETGLVRGGEPAAYGGQEYGIESHGGFSGGGGASPGPGWGVDRDSERRRNFDLDDVGAGQSPAGYAYHAQPQARPEAQPASQGRPHPDQDFDPDYLRWREERLRAHDRDYQEWRREQHRRYDERYRQSRGERAKDR